MFFKLPIMLLSSAPKISLLCSNYAQLCPIMLIMLHKCDWLWENLPLTHKDEYLEIRNSIIQSVISREGSKLHAYNSLQIYSCLIAIRLPTAQSTAS